MLKVRHLSRTDWAGFWIGTPPREQLPDGEAYVHHVGGAAYMGGTVAVGEPASRAAAVRVFQGLNEYAQRPKQLGGKGYQFLDYDVLYWYDRFNHIVWIGEGRGEYRSAATLDRNEQGEAICAAGNFDIRAPHPAEVEGAAYAIVAGIDNGWLTHDTWIGGHRDNPAHPNATACPGRYLYAELPRIRTRVRELLIEAPKPPAPTPMEVIEVITYAEIRDLWVAPNPDDVGDGGSSDRWLEVMIAKVGAIGDIQRRNGLKVTGRYDEPTNLAYARELAAMKKAAGA